MDNPRWWHAAVSVTAVVLAALVLSAGLPQWRTIGALVSLAAFVVGWFVVGRMSWRSPTAALAFAVIIIVTTGSAVLFFPLMAILQCVAYPLVWVILPTLRQSLVGNVALALSVGVGYFVATGDILQTAVTVALSLGFSIALGLWITSIFARSEERQRLLDELSDAQDRLAAVNRDAGVASERERLAREIHDTIAQDLTGLVLLAQRARRELAAGGVKESTLELIEDNSRSVLAETRGLVAGGAAVGIDGGVAAALERLAERFSRETGVQVGVQASAVPSLDRDTEVVLLRIAQEGLANVRKHASASAAVVSLGADDHTVTLTVRDDGTGFDTSARTSGFGLDGMRDRLALVGGALAVSSGSDGTVLSATLPVTP